jgi:hypothetical protein
LSSVSGTLFLLLIALISLNTSLGLLYECILEGSVSGKQPAFYNTALYLVRIHVSILPFPIQ